MCGPKINEQLKSFVSIGLCPPWLLNEPPTIAISDNLKKIPNSPNVSTNKISSLEILKLLSFLKRNMNISFFIAYIKRIIIWRLNYH